MNVTSSVVVQGQSLRQQYARLSANQPPQDDPVYRTDSPGQGGCGGRHQRRPDGPRGRLRGLQGEASVALTYLGSDAGRPDGTVRSAIETVDKALQA
jgi:hypothetical protein